MKSILAFETPKEAVEYEIITKELMAKLKDYQQVLEQHYQLTTIPKGVLWTTAELVTTTFSSIPIPAFTREDIIYISPILKEWQNLLVSQLDGKAIPHIKSFYENFSTDQLFVILAHELTHHIDLFVDEFEDERHDSIWFEEGMCFYLPRKYCLTEEQFKEITAIEQELVNTFTEDYGQNDLNDFGSMSYQGSLSSIMFDYWRSYLKVKSLLEKLDGDIHGVFILYKKWHEQGRETSLVQYFEDIIK
ncbi:hypothetical protein KD050_09285 [Psychrobacillus sp. INOP01]|uniref:hypothetical protein n=1 Tax=Psychrobacillus sp. INOP01 TaxID=2829187 RepID=UPI001BA63839|nr:hypothetical protein [Psychrobacillus sp. INOP01]QUG43391.1 hypothetical protein KD050_09285 [Psychrobacillus sp. INOP01]